MPYNIHSPVIHTVELSLVYLYYLYCVDTTRLKRDKEVDGKRKSYLIQYTPLDKLKSGFLPPLLCVKERGGGKKPDLYCSIVDPSKYRTLL